MIDHFLQLKNSNYLNAIQIHTKPILNLLQQIEPGTLTKVISHINIIGCINGSLGLV